ncbi:MAG TPA: NAD(P)/FAD-dependent oxidoreductase [Gemmatirosa sp.]
MTAPNDTSAPTHPLVDITIIGGGPAGLFATFYAGMRQATAQVVDALPQLGGQLTALYPEKYIFDVAGFPQVLAKDLVKSLADQAARWNFATHLNRRVTGLREEQNGDGQPHFVLETTDGEFPTRALVIAAGIGAFSPRRLPQPVAEGWYGRGIYDVVTNPEDYRGQHVVIIGGGDSAFDWGTQMIGKAAHVTIVHRSDRFRAHGATVAEFKGHVEAGRATLLTFHELADIRMHEHGERFSHIVLKDVKAKTTREVEADVVLPMLGFVSDLGPLAEWGLTLEKDEIVVNSQMETGRAGIYAAGDVTTYPGKLKLIASGFSEAAIAVNQAVHWIHPDKKVTPGHSSNMMVFGQKDD